MVSPNEVGTYVSGLRKLAAGDESGFADLDLSADGFWRSFAAIPYVVPAFFLSWMQYRRAYVEDMGADAMSVADFLLRVGFVDLASWIIPIVIVAFVCIPLGLTGSFGRWVIATNWLSVPIAYAMAAPILLVLAVPAAEGVAMAASLFLFALAVGVYYRVTYHALNRERAVAILVTLGLVVLSLAMTGLSEALLGV